MRSSVFSCLVPLKPALDLRFAIDKYLDPRITFTRASIGTYWDANGVLQTAASGAARFDHDPITGESKGLLIEEARTNLLTYSAQFDDGSWTKAGSSISANAATAPDGTASADKLVEDSSVGSHNVTKSATLAAVAHTFTAFLKAGERTWARLVAVDGGAYFNLATGALGSVSAGSVSLSASAPASVGNGVYRCQVTFTPLAGVQSVSVRAATGDNGNSYAGDGASGLYLWGAQLEAGAFATSYIPTTTAAVNRAADAAVMDGANFSGWYNQAEGSFATTYTPGNVAALDQAVWAIYGTSWVNNAVHMRQFNGSLIAPVYNLAAQEASMSYGTIVAGVRAKTTIGLKTNDVGAARDGAAIAGDTAVTLPGVMAALHIGGSSATSNKLNGSIARITYYNKRLSNPLLSRLST
jgi:hypothetical protein